MSEADPLLDRAAIQDAFHRLGERLARRGIVTDISVVGGAAMTLPTTPAAPPAISTLYANGTKYTPKDLPDSLNVARKMAATGIESLRDLAQAIVATGGLGREQETLYAKVLPALAQQLTALE